MPPLPPRDVPALQFHIRPATPGDIESILRLIKDLAEYEKEPESAQATPELLQANLFDTPYAHTLLAFRGQPPDTYADTTSSTEPDAPSSPEEADAQGPLGMALYFYNFSTWTGKPGIYLEDLYVKPEARNMGIGKALFAELGAIAQEKGCARLDWSVLKWNTPSIAFYEEVLGAKGMDEWRGMRLEEEGIKALAKWSNRSPVD
ncbi:hypothetical protein FRC14_001792 [Serendipita sp. 396]|nr:hypothetical protein FRC14_001792 [Serendipita sp. 396]KAG8785930.1 hypothetical protein FRC15_000421 [Serendipita sp. 397]KAG8800663.1 hypothetical protein FRC16_002340 [Serendipita sp. 398]KAG8806418.1 hypothetical protein FRC19_007266 [Serendipita sp. 401]KAG8807929.1 hypothetical protein FRC18_005307 [Serendipita sp. 400]KAG8853457.1 hypothetical protein FRB91_004903 [Serendipita sp. 411]KAG8873917.1 hypothetical protein FRC20_007277 [Serendipita sp. 405]